MGTPPLNLHDIIFFQAKALDPPLYDIATPLVAGSLLSAFHNRTCISPSNPASSVLVFLLLSPFHFLSISIIVLSSESPLKRVFNPFPLSLSYSVPVLFLLQSLPALLHLLYVASS